MLLEVKGRLDLDTFRALPRAVTIRSISLPRTPSLAVHKLQYVAVREYGVKCTQGLSVVFLTTTGESTTTSK